MQFLKTIFVISLFLVGFQDTLSADDYVFGDSSVDKVRPMRPGMRRGMRPGMRRGMRPGMGPRRGYRGPRRGRGWRRPYRRYTHRPYRRNWRRHHSRYHYPYNYYRSFPYRYIWLDRWIRYSVNYYRNGYHWFRNYPYFVFNDYIHRYSNRDICNYELVNRVDQRTVETFHGQACNVGYDACAQQRDELNFQSSSYKYFCSERWNSNRN